MYCGIFSSFSGLYPPRLVDIADCPHWFGPRIIVNNIFGDFLPKFHWISRTCESDDTVTVK